MNKKRPIGIDLFAGAGGLSLGFEQAGFDIRAAIEIDPIHCAIHKYNFPNSTIIPYSVKGLSGKEIRTLANIGKCEIDCVFGGPPCQGFSLIGQRLFDDSRNKLVAEFVRLVVELNAKTFVFENVKGLTIGKHKRFLTELIKAFENAGYEIVKPWKVLNAAHYGVPQFRERFFLIGVKKGISSLPHYPLPIFNPADGRKKIAGLPNGPTVFDAIGDLPNADNFKSLEKYDSVKTNAYKKPSPYAIRLRELTNKTHHYGYLRKWDSSILTSSNRTKHTDISRRRFLQTPQGEVEPISRFLRLSPNSISNTLRAGTDGARGAFTSPRPIHYLHPRCITVREMARLHGFPDWFRFHVTKWHGARQIGNAVPPPLAKAVAESILSALSIEPIKPNEIIELGNSDLLGFNLSQASHYFRVDRPMNKRDRKSGNKKRKQEDIEEERRRKHLKAENA